MQSRPSSVLKGRENCHVCAIFRRDVFTRIFKRVVKGGTPGGAPVPLGCQLSKA